MWYGVSTIVGRFINLFTTPIIGILATAIQGQQGSLYAAIAFLNIVFTFGMETTFFRFARDENPDKVFNIATSTIIAIGLPLATLLILFKDGVSTLLSVPNNPHLVILATTIILIDAIASMPFARLRLNSRPRKFAFIKIVAVLLNVFFVFFFIKICPWIKVNGYLPNIMQHFHLEEDALTYILFSNLVASGVALFFLIPDFRGFKFQLEKKLLSQMLFYTLPLVIVGLGGMINDMFDKLMLPQLLDGTLEYRNTQTGIYVQNFKLAALLIIFTQAFRMGAEPFFIKESTEKNAPLTYARIMNLFVIVCCVGMLTVLLFYDIWKLYIRADLHPERTEGFMIVPILLFAKILYGIYYNLSVWFKLENKTHIGAIITLVGAAITLIFNIIFIPLWGYIACAWASLACYGFMVIASYLLGQKYYPVPYNVKKILVYLLISFTIYFVHQYFVPAIDSIFLRIISGIAFMIVFIVFALLYDRKEFAALPLIGRYLK